MHARAKVKDKKTQCNPYRPSSTATLERISKKRFLDYLPPKEVFLQNLCAISAAAAVAYTFAEQHQDEKIRNPLNMQSLKFPPLPEHEPANRAG
ncbi:hypothetical protein AVEN_223772-1 [Araneus ventricosus]|uniref:Uncharacterized protein n=1 Tax=Araneus ventricosus TaxID=182803 RepID=A0A4Y2DKA7_ARAVE|nr:hypothetical protein AVEN_223772-1 [Araneus ventricosus]